MTGILAATNDRFLVNPTIRWRGQESALEGRPLPVILAPTNGRFRRNPVVAPRSGEGPFTTPPGGSAR
jgi:hypothetical protein